VAHVYHGAEFGSQFSTLSELLFHVSNMTVPLFGSGRTVRPVGAAGAAPPPAWFGNKYGSKHCSHGWPMSIPNSTEALSRSARFAARSRPVSVALMASSRFFPSGPKVFNLSRPRDSPHAQALFSASLSPAAAAVVAFGEGLPELHATSATDNASVRRTATRRCPRRGMPGGVPGDGGAPQGR
jgi:hypothetical protein